MKKQANDSDRMLVKGSGPDMEKIRAHRHYLKMLLSFLFEQLDHGRTHDEWARKVVSTGYFEDISQVIKDARLDLPEMLFLMDMALCRNAPERAKGGVK